MCVLFTHDATEPGMDLPEVRPCLGGHRPASRATPNRPSWPGRFGSPAQLKVFPKGPFPDFFRLLVGCRLFLLTSEVDDVAVAVAYQF